MDKEVLDSKLIFDGKFIKIHLDKVRFPNGEIIEKEVVDRINGVSVLPIKNDKLLLIREYLPSIDRYIWKVPGGGIEGGVGTPIESPIEAAQRELSEEIGYKSNNLELLFETYGSETVRHKVSYYLATDLYKSNEVCNIDEQEFIELFPIELNKAVKMGRNAEFQNPAFSLMILMAEDKLI